MSNEIFKNIEIIHTAEDFIVVNKPAGLLVHKTGAKDFTEPTLADFLLKKFPKIKTVGDEPTVRPGIVHRLDRDVSGLMVVCLSQKFFDHLKKEFQNHEVEKQYLALVHGEIPRPEGTIEFNIARKATGEKMSARPRGEKEGEKEAITHFEVLENFKKYALVKVDLETGRTNQIRVHFNAYGHPLVGDFTYRPKKLKPRKYEKELGRVFLHARKLGFYDLANQWQEFTSDLPAELRQFLKNSNFQETAVMYTDILHFFG